MVIKGGIDPGSDAINLHDAEGVVCNYHVINESTGRSGFLNGKTDRDGILRRLPLVMKFDGKLYPSFALALLMEHFDHDVLVFAGSRRMVPNFKFMEHTFPVDSEGTIPAHRSSG